MAAVGTNSGPSLGVRLFGNSVQPPDGMRDVFARVPLFVVEATADEFTRFQRETLLPRLPGAFANLSRLIGEQRDIPAAAQGELNILRTAFESISTITGGTSASPLAEVLWDAIEHLAAQVIEAREGWNAEVSFCLRHLDRVSGVGLKTAVETFEEALGCTTADRGAQLRDARRAFQEHLTDVGSDAGPPAFLALGWLAWQCSGVPAEGAPFLVETTRRAGEGYPVCRQTACWMLAHGALLDEDLDGAVSWINLAADARVDAQVLHDAAVIQALARNMGETKRRCGEAIAASPICTVSVLASGATAALGRDLADLLVRYQSKLRQEARHKVLTWASEARKAQEALRLAECSSLMQSESLEGHREAQKILDKADLLTVWQICDQADHGTRMVVKNTQAALKREHGKRKETVTALREKVEACWKARERRIEGAMVRQRKSVTSAREALTVSAVDSEKAQRGCMFGLFSGCAVFTLYVATASILALTGIRIGLDSFVGILAVVLSLTPIIIAMLVNLAQGIRRMGLDRELSKSVEEANLAYEEAVRQADILYRRDMEGARDQLATAEKELQRLEVAVRMLAQASTPTR